MDPTKVLMETLTKGIDPLLRWALVLAAVATVVMALLEAAKGIFRLRYAYHWAFVTKWLGPNAYKEVLSLTLGRAQRPGPLLDQPTDKLMAQLQASANLALDFPTTFPALYEILTRVTAGNAQDAATWKQFSADVESGAIANPSTDPKAGPASRARARLDHVVARKLDSFQTKTEFWWARLNQLVAVAGSAILLLVLQKPVTSSTVIVAIIGGMVAPVAKDLAAALSGLRGK